MWQGCTLFNIKYIKITELCMNIVALKVWITDKIKCAGQTPSAAADYALL